MDTVFNMDTISATTLLSSLVPIAGLIGALICVPLIPIISRRYELKLFRHFLLYISIFSLLGLGLIQIPNFPCLIIGKLVQGLAAGA